MHPTHPDQNREELSNPLLNYLEDTHDPSAYLIADWASKTTPTATHYLNPNPTPTIGTAAPVPQPGRPPMSQKATDHASLVLVYSLSSLPIGASCSLVLWAVANVPAEVLAIAALAPVGLVGAIGIAARLIGRAVADGASALPHNYTHHHSGPTYVHHTELRTTTRGFGRTHNQLPTDHR